MKIYAILMHRYGDESSHSYMLGFVKDKILGEIYGVENGTLIRGSKYDHNLVEFEIDIPEDQDKVLVLHTYNDDREDMTTNVFLNRNDAKQFLLDDDRDFFELTQHHIFTDFDDNSVIECMDSLYCFSKEAQDYIKDKYEEIARRQL